MNSVTLAIFGFIVFFLGYKFYSKWLSKRIYDLHKNIKTLAHEFRDDLNSVLLATEKTDFSFINPYVFSHGNYHLFIGNQGETVFRI